LTGALAKLDRSRHNTAPNRQKGVEVRTNVTTASPKVRELFIEELADVHAGSPIPSGPYTTYACCEEGPFGCCEILPDLPPKP
jgi:hypothetical protein